MPTDKKNPKPYNFLGPETDRENALYRAEIKKYVAIMSVVAIMM